MNLQAYERVAAELKRKRKKSWTWLAEKLGHSRGRVGNWKRRGVPADDYASIATVLGQSMDWVAGMTNDHRAISEPSLSPMALRVAKEFDQITDDGQRLDAFAKVIAVITLARAKD